MDRAQVLYQQLRDFFLSLPPGRRFSFAATAIGAIVGTVALALWLQKPSFKVLFAHLEGNDAAAAIEYLKSEGIPYRVDGSAIEVPRDNVYETRMALAGRGVPQGGGVGFEIFDKQTLGMTDFVQRLGYQRALQGELARTIGELGAVERARVHLALPERSLFVSEDRHPSASVVLKLRPGRSLNEEQVSAVIHLVSASVEGLKPGDVTVVDTGGGVLSRGPKDSPEMGEGGGFGGLRKETEKEYTDRIESMLERILGPGHAVARVTVQLDLAQVERTEESFDPDKTALRTEKRSAEKNVGSQSSGVPGVTAALTNEPEPAKAAEGGPRTEREDSVLSYEITRTTSRRIEGRGAIEKVSVAVVIDGVSKGEGAAAKIEPRAQDELDRYRDLIKRAVGFDEKRGDEIEVVSVPFKVGADVAAEETGFLARIEPYTESIWRGAGLLIVLIIALMVVRPFLMSMAERAPVAQIAIEKPVEQIEQVEGEQLVIAQPKRPQYSGITELARQNPEQTAMVIRQWVNSGGS